MPPRAPDVVAASHTDDLCHDSLDLVPNEEIAPQEAKNPPMQIVWRNVAIFTALHLAALYSLVLIPSANPLTWIWTVFLYVISALGITAGAHRLWSHRSYKAKLPLRIFLAICNSTALQNDIYEWSRDHRVHHKYSETSGDPHNAMRGFFFSHIGWLLVKKHPDVIAKGKLLELSDLMADPVVKFQRRGYGKTPFKVGPQPSADCERHQSYGLCDCGKLMCVYGKREGEGKDFCKCKCRPGYLGIQCTIPTACAENANSKECLEQQTTVL